MTATNLNETAVVSNIQRFCIHDGPGIRTGVFLKGCPLRCAWCSNPETQRFTPELMLRANGCMLCGKCAAACPKGALGIKESVLCVERGECDSCGTCAKACPRRLPSVCGERMSAGRVMEIVLRDRPFYGASGGLTLSGGEPLAQPKFCAALLEKAKAAGVSTCIETTLYAPLSTLRELAPLLDHIIFDYKHADAAKHDSFTGVDNALIRENVAWLTRARPDAHARVPMIPGFNDSPGDIALICESLRELGVKRVELMRFHNLAGTKYRALGREYGYENVPALGDDAYANAVESFSRNSVEVVGGFE